MLPCLASPEPSKCQIESAYESSGASEQWWPIGRPHRDTDGVETTPSKFMPLYWENAKRELREVRHDGNRDYHEYDDHHRRSGYASQNALQVDHSVPLRKIIQASVELGKKEYRQPLATTLILIRLGHCYAARGTPRLGFKGCGFPREGIMRGWGRGAA